jgi:lipopolysaccharide biosynthesis glycosyltransferase
VLVRFRGTFLNFRGRSWQSNKTIHETHEAELSWCDFVDRSFYKPKEKAGSKMTQARAICTIIAKNYLAFARTLAQSFLSLHPDYKCYVLIVDDFEGYVDTAAECFEIISLTEIGIPDLTGFRFKYDVKELCTAAKADLLEYLIEEKSVERLLYLDPDILVTGRLDDIFEKLGKYDVVLTPHLDTDYPDDDLLPNVGHILRAGTYNLGFIGVNSSANARAFLNWWKPKLYKNCVIDLLNGYFVDQKFIDLAPIFFKNIFIETDVGYNVAYWNLHSRRISREKGSWRCNGGPLYFFHFSGYAPEGALISTHISHSQARYRLSNRRDVRPLFAEYKNLIVSNGHEQASQWPYTFGYFKTGEPIPNGLRWYYREFAAKRRGYEDPFDLKQLERRIPAHAMVRLTPAAHLDAILKSRAWRWVSRYGRFKNRFLVPPFEFVRRFLKK